MINLGKTHIVEFAYGGWGANQRLGTPWNPWDGGTHRAPGGSSSGSGVAVAARGAGAILAFRPLSAATWRPLGGFDLLLRKARPRDQRFNWLCLFAAAFVSGATNA
jgi:hypothetical protein